MTASAPGVRITGMGIVSSIGHDVAAFGRSLAAGRSGIGRLNQKPAAASQAGIGAEIGNFSFETMLQQISSASDALKDAALRAGWRAPLPLQASVLAALQAWSQSRLQSGQIPPERIGLVIAGHNTTQNYQYGLTPEFQRHPEYLSPRYALQAMDSNQIGVLSEMLGIKGEGFVTGGASASGNVGIIHGARLIQAGLADACLVVGVAADLSPMEIQGFQNVGAMGGKRFAGEPEKACRPFDSLHDGFIHGQAAACLVLESGAAAGARKAPNLAALLGGAINLHATASPAPDLDGEANAMNGALRHSGVAAEDIDYVNTHGSASPLGDAIEIRAIERVFGAHFPKVWLNATKGLTGHCLHSAGIVEAIACIVQMTDGFIHPNANLENPIEPRARFCGATAVRARIRTAMSNSFGFAGINTSIVLRAPSP